ncbi:MAG: hypothetical protein JSS34_08450 [Proteobacteria bacterium]|nr:hypothetical protein [Pseudomonadota bacterium]
MTYSDQEIIDVINMLMSGKGDEFQIEKWSKNELKGLDEIYDLIFFSKIKMTPEEILKKARELSKPLIL